MAIRDRVSEERRGITRWILPCWRRVTADFPWRAIGARYLPSLAVVSLLWETLQLPLYTVWTEAPLARNVLAVLHCSAGDVAIGTVCLLLSLRLLRPPSSGAEQAPLRHVVLSTVLLAVAYTIFSEWLNVSIRGAWAYTRAMPVLPLLGTGVLPLLQWMVVPTVCIWFAFGRRDNRPQRQRVDRFP